MINTVINGGVQIFRKMSLTVKPKVVFVLGGPGAGKGTQCENIVREYGFVHLSAGELLRDERQRSSSQYGELIETHIRNGTIVPVEITCKLIDIAMKNAQTNRFLIDGFPRNKDNLEGWKREMGDKVHLLFVLFLDCAENVCIKRCLQRGALGSGRSDDNEETLKKRIQTFYNDSLPIIEHYKTMDLVKTIDAGKSKEEVFDDIKKVFDKI